ncbi:MAG: nucleotidyltransferase domain-containing protein [bacterium]|nr:nucleotidyltransferase domain-containing protein [bacterium]
MPSAEVQQMIPTIQRFFESQPVERAYLFGSCSRGEETNNSDVDLLVTYTDSNSLSLLDISRMMVQLGRQLKRKVDMVEEDCLRPFAQESVNRDKIKIYERAN